MTQPVLLAEQLGKRYLLGRQKAAATAAATPRRRWPFSLLSRGPRTPDAARELWALRDVSFAVERGTVLGVIGPNGAGKSTLLKIIARITRPTEGRVIGHGRVVSLIELGAGFNPDLSGRENVFMNSAMHGVSKTEVRARLSDIVEFAEMERFLDTPVKYYSSGMFLRLAFSVAIHLDPTILLADEILAVGDIAFQERCWARVQEESRRGLTVLFVSHDLAAVTRICQQVLWLDSGRIAGFGPADAVAAAYRETALTQTLAKKDRAVVDAQPVQEHANHLAEIISVQLIESEGQLLSAAHLAAPVAVRVRIRSFRPMVRLRCTVDVLAKGTLVFRATQPEEYEAERRATYDLVLHIPAHFLAEAKYSVSVRITTNGTKGTVAQVNALSFFGYSDDASGDHKAGVIAPKLEWTVHKVTPRRLRLSPA